MGKMYEYDVALGATHVTVTAPDRLSATKKAAAALGVIWKQEARNMVVIQGRQLRGKELGKMTRAQEAGKHGLAPSQSPAATALPQRRAKGADAPGREQKAGNRGVDNPSVTAAPGQRRGKTGPTFKSGPLAGQPMKTGKGR